MFGKCVKNNPEAIKHVLIDTPEHNHLLTFSIHKTSVPRPRVDLASSFENNSPPLLPLLPLTIDNNQGINPKSENE